MLWENDLASPSQSVIQIKWAQSRMRYNRVCVVGGNRALSEVLSHTCSEVQLCVCSEAHVSQSLTLSWRRAEHTVLVSDEKGRERLVRPAGGVLPKRSHVALQLDAG